MRFLLAESNAPSSSKGISTLPVFLVTCSKDTFVKLWDLTTQHCVQTIVAHRSEVWTLDIDPNEDMLLTGSGEGEVKAWKINQTELKSGLQESSSGEVCLFVSIRISHKDSLHFSAHQDDTSIKRAACFISAAYLANTLSPYGSISRHTITRPIY